MTGYGGPAAPNTWRRRGAYAPLEVCRHGRDRQSVAGVSNVTRNNFHGAQNPTRSTYDNCDVTVDRRLRSIPTTPLRRRSRQVLPDFVMADDRGRLYDYWSALETVCLALGYNSGSAVGNLIDSMLVDAVEHSTVSHCRTAGCAEGGGMKGKTPRRRVACEGRGRQGQGLRSAVEVPPRSRHSRRRTTTSRSTGSRGGMMTPADRDLLARLRALLERTPPWRVLHGALKRSELARIVELLESMQA